jgi:hypothetical protein
MNCTVQMLVHLGLLHLGDIRACKRPSVLDGLFEYWGGMYSARRPPIRRLQVRTGLIPIGVA